MIIRKVKNNNVICLINKDEDIEGVESLEYIISIENREEYDSGTETLIAKLLLLNNIKVYQYITNSRTLQFDCNKILATNDFIIIIETHDESKFELLESTIKQYMIVNKEYLQ